MTDVEEHRNRWDPAQRLSRHPHRLPEKSGHKHRDDVLEDYVVLCLWLSAQSSWLAYLGLANKTVVNKYLEKFLQYCQELDQVSNVKDKKHLVAS